EWNGEGREWEGASKRMIQKECTNRMGVMGRPLTGMEEVGERGGGGLGRRWMGNSYSQAQIQPNMNMNMYPVWTSGSERDWDRGAGAEMKMRIGQKGGNRKVVMPSSARPPQRAEVPTCEPCSHPQIAKLALILIPVTPTPISTQGSESGLFQNTLLHIQTPKLSRRRTRRLPPLAHFYTPSPPQSSPHPSLLATKRIPPPTDK
ncbi:hypothetical protein FA13DRAFT_1718363, partial [Coprinellus micaceus]